MYQYLLKNISVEDPLNKGERVNPDGPDSSSNAVAWQDFYDKVSSEELDAAIEVRLDRMTFPQRKYMERYIDEIREQERQRIANERLGQYLKSLSNDVEAQRALKIIRLDPPDGSFKLHVGRNEATRTSYKLSSRPMTLEDINGNSLRGRIIYCGNKAVLAVARDTAANTTKLYHVNYKEGDLSVTEGIFID
ncbi:MAG: hypothetical protein LBJ25_03545, partial [Candidatus Margulisbacteria bacterium]|nr:hypothetical protein [Candidatus Margulisiibacteriota bacterium]